MTVARHVPERYSYSKVLILVAFLLELSGLDFGFGDTIAHYLLELPNSRKMEFEGGFFIMKICIFLNVANISWCYQADKIGLHLASKACYDPQAAVECVPRFLVKIYQPFFWLTVVIGSQNANSFGSNGKKDGTTEYRFHLHSSNRTETHQRKSKDQRLEYLDASLTPPIASTYKVYSQRHILFELGVLDVSL